MSLYVRLLILVFGVGLLYAVIPDYIAIETWFRLTGNPGDIMKGLERLAWVSLLLVAGLALTVSAIFGGRKN